jgi:hypothetical protein
MLGPETPAERQRKGQEAREVVNALVEAENPTKTASAIRGGELAAVPSRWQRRRAQRACEHWTVMKQRRRAGLTRNFAKLLEGMTEQDLAFVHNLDIMASEVRLLNMNTRSLEKVANELPWPVKFTMIRYHHKHVFESRGPPSRRQFVRDLGSLENKFKWRAALITRGSEENLSWAKHKMYEVSKFRGTVAPAMRDFLSGLRHTATRAFNQVRKRHTTGDMLRVVRDTLGWLAERGLTFAPFDKESGVCLIKTTELESVKQEVMKSEFYEVVTEDLDTVQKNFRRQYFKLAKLVEVTKKIRSYRPHGEKVDELR